MSEEKLKLYACFLDLKRAAIYFYKNPKGKTYKVFLANALESLNTIPDKKLNKFKKEVINLQKLTSNQKFSKKERLNVADDILTTGILLRP